MGVKQWIFQRISNLVFVLFGIWLLVGLLSGNEAATLSGLLADSSSQLFMTVVLVLAGLNSILAGWQIAGDYAAKINLSENLLTALIAAASIAFVVMGFNLLY